MKQLVGNRARKLLSEGIEIKKEKEAVCFLFVLFCFALTSKKTISQTKTKQNKIFFWQAEAAKKRKLKRKAEARAKEYQSKVYLLETDYKKLEESYQNQGGNIIWHWSKLFFGIISVSLSFMWVLQFCLAQVPVSLGDQPIIPLLSNMFEQLDQAPFAGPCAYGYDMRFFVTLFVLIFPFVFQNICFLPIAVHPQG